MSTWSKPVEPASIGVQLFSYPAPGGSANLDLDDASLSSTDVKTALSSARLEGIREGEARARASIAESIKAERAALAHAVRRLADEQAALTRRLEPEVIRLALAIARKILHREAMVDPMLLAGIVRSALERLDSTTRIKLRVGADHAKNWTVVFEGWNGLSIEVVPDLHLMPDTCRIETEVGTTDISLEGPLKEIEHGFFDLLAQRNSAEMCQ